MIRYSLKCTSEHRFDSWFKSAEAFETLRAAGHVNCPECGASDVEKTLMAPRVRPARSKAAERPLSVPETEQEKAVEAIRKEVESNSEYVGMKFADEARAMHDGDTPSRAIYGEAKIEDAKSLIEDGIPVAPLPFTPKSKAN